MPNSSVISRVNAGLARCLSHHRRLCRGIAELERLIHNDEFLKDPRTQWLLHQRRQTEEEQANADARISPLGRMGCEMGRLLGRSKINLSPQSRKVSSSTAIQLTSLMSYLPHRTISSWPGPFAKSSKLKTPHPESSRDQCLLQLHCHRQKEGRVSSSALACLVLSRKDPAPRSVKVVRHDIL